jgi:hypothetical protein
MGSIMDLTASKMHWKTINQTFPLVYRRPSCGPPILAPTTVNALNAGSAQFPFNLSTTNIVPYQPPAPVSIVAPALSLVPSLTIRSHLPANPTNNLSRGLPTPPFPDLSLFPSPPDSALLRNSSREIRQVRLPLLLLLSQATCLLAVPTLSFCSVDPSPLLHHPPSINPCPPPAPFAIKRCWSPKTPCLPTRSIPIPLLA